MAWLDGVSLAPLKFRNVMATKGGPIESLRISPSHTVNGKQVYQCLAFLKEDLRPKNNSHHSIYSDAEGCGTSLYQSEAAHIAVSEALERWAYYETSQDDRKRNQYGFDLEKSTTGMASFPGLTHHSARRRALNEAIERHSIIEWWKGRFQNESPKVLTDGIELINLITPFSEKTVILVAQVHTTNGVIYAYGFATHQKLNRAIKKAEIELNRNKTVLEIQSITKDSPANINERRLLYFSSAQGHSNFRENVMERERKNNALTNLPRPSLLIDSEIKGPWSKYTCIWRCLLEGQLSEDSKETVDLFMF